jgi:hypothetical protein
MAAAVVLVVVSVCAVKVDVIFAAATSVVVVFVVVTVVLVEDVFVDVITVRTPVACCTAIPVVEDFLARVRQVVDDLRVVVCVVGVTGAWPPESSL